MERQAEAFYRRFAEQVQNSDVRDLCRELADDENRHLRLIENMLSRWEPLPVTRGDLRAMDANGKLRRLFLSPPSSNASKGEIVEYARNEEVKMVAFYAGFEREFTSEWKITKLSRMVTEEQGHVKRLSDILSGLREREVRGELRG
jgi:rubrerythrin